LNILKAKGRRINVESKNLIEIKSKGEISFNADFIKTKVAPQIKVINKSTVSGKNFFMKREG
jgi:hypothetical protein